MKLQRNSLVIEGSERVEVQLRRSARSRRLSLRVSRLDGRVTLSLPLHTPLGDARDFLNEKADWVLGHLAERPQLRVPRLGGTLPFAGREMPIRAAKGTRASLDADGFAVAMRKPVGPQLAGLLKVHARSKLAARCDHHATRLGRPFHRLTLRDTRSRWGSCTSAGNLMFSWRLTMAPLEVLDYVAAHEVAHLAEMNHGARFWAHVAALCPDYETHRDWLRGPGLALHQIDFAGDVS